jgi:hypothetical protein
MVLRWWKVRNGWMGAGGRGSGCCETIGEPRGQFRTGVEASKAAIVALPKVWSEHTCSDQLNQPFPFADRRNTSHMQWRLTEEES